MKPLALPFPLVWALWLLCPPARADPALAINPAVAAPGTTASLTVLIDADVQGLCGLLLSLEYDFVAPVPTLGDFSQADLGTPFAGSLFEQATSLDSPDLAPGQQEIVGIVHAEPIDGPADVIRLRFQVPTFAPVGTVYRVAVSAAGNDQWGIKLPINAATGTITVIPLDQAVLQPGDIDGNGRLEIADVILVLRAALQLETLSSDQFARADLDGDGRITVGDAVAVLRKAVGLSS